MIKKVVMAEGNDSQGFTWTRQTIQSCCNRNLDTDPIDVKHPAGDINDFGQHITVGHVRMLENRNTYIIAHIEMIDPTPAGCPDITSIMEHVVFRAMLDRANVDHRKVIGSARIACIFVIPKVADAQCQCRIHDDALKAQK